MMSMKIMPQDNDGLDGRKIETKRRWWRALPAIGILVILMLAGAYGIGSLLGNRLPANRSAGIVDMAGGVIQTELEAAEELPKSSPTLWGMIENVEGNSIFVIQLPSLDQIIAQEAVNLGSTFEVVVTNQTIVYKDVTSGPAVAGVVYEKVALGDINEIEEGNLIKVWGEKKGDRIVALVFKYDNHTQLVTPWGPIN